MRINIKPLSVNEAWKGSRKRTDKYKAYTKHLLLLLRPLRIPKTGKLRLTITFGFSYSGADIDNPLKPTIDILQKKYLFNDSRFYEMNVKKEIAPKGKEFIDFEITEI